MVATVGGCPPTVRFAPSNLAMFAALLSAACAMPLFHMEVDNNNVNIFMEPSALAADTISENVKMATLMNGLAESRLLEHLRLNGDRLT